MAGPAAASAEEMLKGRVYLVLWSDALKAISFNLGQVTITSAVFLWVAHWITNGTIRVFARPTSVKGAEAEFDRNENAIVLPHVNYLLGANSVFESSAVVHESVHAWIFNSKLKMPDLYNEMISFIASTTFMESLGLKPDPAKTSSAFLAAHIVARHVLAGTNLNVPPASDDVNNLRYGILNQDIYRNLQPPPGAGW